MNKLKNKKIFIIVAILAVLLIACIGIIFSMQLSKDSEDTDEVIQAQVQQTPVPTPTKSPSQLAVEKGESLLGQGQYEQAIRELETYQSEPEASELLNKCYFEWGKKLRSEEKYDEAIDALQHSTLSEAKGEIDFCKQKKLEKSEFLRVQYAVNQSDQDMDGKFFENGSGKLKFQADIPMEDWCGDGMYVTYCEPLSKIHFRLNNLGNVTLKNVTLILAFEGVVLKEIDNGEFTYQNHCRGIGGWGGAIATYDSIQSGLCISTIFSLQEAYSFNGKDGGNLTITVSADNYPAKSYTVPVKLKK